MTNITRARTETNALDHAMAQDSALFPGLRRRIPYPALFMIPSPSPAIFCIFPNPAGDGNLVTLLQIATEIHPHAELYRERY